MATQAEEWQVWLAKHGAALVLFARQWATSREDAEDIVQEAFLRFWRSRHKARDVLAYLYTCVKCCALEWRRGSLRRQRREAAVARPDGAGAEGLFACPLEQDERRALIEAALRGLPEAQREVLVLKTWGSLSFPQIAVALDISANTAASRYRYALARLRAVLAEEPIP